MNVVAIVQARMGSTRFPGKVLHPIAGRPMLAWVIERLRLSRLLDQVVVATSMLESDQPIVQWCQEHLVSCYRGSEQDVLARYHQCAEACAADCVVRITSDCPLIDPTLLDELVSLFLRSEGRYDYVSNTLPPRTFPRGLDVEVFSRHALEVAHREASTPEAREHVTPYLYRHPELFRLQGAYSTRDYSSHRWTVDTREDWELIDRILRQQDSAGFSWQSIVRLLDQHPEWLELNADVLQKVA